MTSLNLTWCALTTFPINHNIFRWWHSKHQDFWTSTRNQMFSMNIKTAWVITDCWSFLVRTSLSSVHAWPRLAQHSDVCNCQDETDSPYRISSLSCISWGTHWARRSRGTLGAWQTCRSRVSTITLMRITMVCIILFGFILNQWHSIGSCCSW